jgi:hypothetical protein
MSYDSSKRRERLASEDLTLLLNHYLTEMSQIALSHGATNDKYVGDAIVIFFGDPETRGVNEDALACVEMAIAMRKRPLELNEQWRGWASIRDIVPVGNFVNSPRSNDRQAGQAARRDRFGESERTALGPQPSNSNSLPGTETANFGGVVRGSYIGQSEKSLQAPSLDSRAFSGEPLWRTPSRSF